MLMTVRQIRDVNEYKIENEDVDEDGDENEVEMRIRMKIKRALVILRNITITFNSENGLSTLRFVQLLVSRLRYAQA